MCLEIKTNSRIQTAKKDIVVYKYLSIRKIFKESLSGLKYTAVIKNIPVSGKIHIDNCGYMYLCSNEERCDGGKTNIRYGYEFSWALDGNVKNLKIKNVDFKSIDELYEEVYVTPYLGHVVEIGKTYKSFIRVSHCAVHEALHSYKSVNRCTKNAKSGRHDVVVAKCIIPAESKYYVGLFNNSISYASDNLTYDSIVKKYSNTSFI